MLVININTNSLLYVYSDHRSIGEDTKHMSHQSLIQIYHLSAVEGQVLIEYSLHCIMLMILTIVVVEFPVGYHLALILMQKAALLHPFLVEVDKNQLTCPLLWIIIHSAPKAVLTPLLHYGYLTPRYIYI